MLKVNHVEQPNMWISATKKWEQNQETAGFTMKLELRQTTFWISYQQRCWVYEQKKWSKTVISPQKMKIFCQRSCGFIIWPGNGTSPVQNITL